MTTKNRNVLFLCTGNSARSVLAEVMLNHLGRGHFTAAFKEAARILRRRIELFLALPLEKLEAGMVKRTMDDIGRQR